MNSCTLHRHANLLPFYFWFIYVKTFFIHSNSEIHRARRRKVWCFRMPIGSRGSFFDTQFWALRKSKSRKSHTNLRSRTDKRENVTPQWKINFVNDSIATSATELHFGTISLLCVFSFRCFFLLLQIKHTESVLMVNCFVISFTFHFCVDVFLCFFFLSA